VAGGILARAQSMTIEQLAMEMQRMREAEDRLRSIAKRDREDKEREWQVRMLQRGHSRDSVVNRRDLCDACLETEQPEDHGLRYPLSNKKSGRSRKQDKRTTPREAAFYRR